MNHRRTRTDVASSAPPFCWACKQGLLAGVEYLNKTMAQVEEQVLQDSEDRQASQGMRGHDEEPCVHGSFLGRVNGRRGIVADDASDRWESGYGGLRT